MMLRYDDLFQKARNLVFQKTPFGYWYFLKLLFEIEQMTTKPAGIQSYLTSASAQTPCCFCCVLDIVFPHRASGLLRAVGLNCSLQ